MISLSGRESVLRKRDELQGIADARLMAWLRYSVREMGGEVAEAAKTGWLSGQALNVVTGTTREHVAMYRRAVSRSRSEWVIRPGVGVRGMQNYLGRWAGTAHEFMRPAWDSKGGKARLVRMIEANVARMAGEVREGKR